MAKLDLFSGRQPHIVELEQAGEKKQFKIPTDYTEEEIERVLELAAKAEANQDVKARRSVIFEQLLILFRRYQPDMTLEQLKALLTWNDAIAIINFVSEHTFAVEPLNEDGESTEPPKKAPAKS